MSTKKEKCMVQIPSYDDDGEEKDVDYWFCCLKDMPCPDHSQSEMELVYCKVCHKDHALRKGELPCHQTESIDLDEIDNKITDLVQRLPFEKRGEIWTLIHESRKQAVTAAVEVSKK